VELNTLAEELTQLRGALAAAHAARAAGQTESVATAPLYAAHPLLMRREEVAELRPRAAEPDVQPVFAALVRAQILGGCAPLLDAMQAAFDHEMLKGLDSKWHFGDTETRIEREADRKQRKLLDQARRRSLARHEPDFLAALHRSHTLMVDRGFGSYAAMCVALWGDHLTALLEAAEGFLADTQTRYRALLVPELREAGVFPDDARHHDMGFLWGGHWGPASGLPSAIDVLRSTLADLALSPESLPGVTSDLESRDGKRPGVLVAAVDPPQDVRLTFSPSDAWTAIPELLAGAGVALALAAAPVEQAATRRTALHPAVTATWRAVFASLYGNPEWISRHLPGVDGERQQRRFHLWWLYEVRRLCGAARFASFLHGPGEPGDKADVYEHYLHQASGARFERDHYLAHTPWFLEDTQTLRGHLFAARLLDLLENRCGSAWFTKPEAGALLRDLWRAGWDRLEPLATVAGVADADNIWPLTERLEAVLGEFTDEEDD